MNVHDSIIRPIITEKSMHDAGKHTFSFVVAGQATKKDVKEAVEKLFSVNVVKVATNTLKGGTVRTGMKRMEVAKQPTKKAFVTLKEGQKIDAFEIAQ